MPGVGSLNTDVFHREVWCSQCFPVQVCDSVPCHCFDVLAAELLVCSKSMSLCLAVDEGFCFALHEVLGKCRLVKCVGQKGRVIESFRL